MRWGNEIFGFRAAKPPDSPAIRGMRPLESYSDETWDRFFNWLAEGVCDMTDEEVRQALDDAGIDMRPAYGRLHKAIEAAKRNDVRVGD